MADGNVGDGAGRGAPEKKADAPGGKPEQKPEEKPEEKKDELVEAIRRSVPVARPFSGSDRSAVEIDSGELLKLMACLRMEFKFDYLEDHTVVDQIEAGKFELIYLLNSLKTGKQMLVSCSISREDPVAPSVCSIWPVAQWQERENYDFFGVLYSDHPDLRRLFLEDEWKGFPLRKDYKDDFVLEPPANES